MPRLRAMPPIYGGRRSGGESPLPVFDFEIVEKKGAGCKLVLPEEAGSNSRLADAPEIPYVKIGAKSQGHRNAYDHHSQPSC